AILDRRSLLRRVAGPAPGRCGPAVARPRYLARIGARPICHRGRGIPLIDRGEGTAGAGDGRLVDRLGVGDRGAGVVLADGDRNRVPALFTENPTARSDRLAVIAIPHNSDRLRRVPRAAPVR